MSLALARTHAPGQPEYVLAHSLWVERTPTCVSGRGSGRGEVALPAGVGLSKFGVGTGFGGCDNTKPGSRNLSIHACFSSESMISCRGHWSHRTTGSQARPVRSRGHRIKHETRMLGWPLRPVGAVKVLILAAQFFALIPSPPGNAYTGRRGLPGNPGRHLLGRKHRVEVSAGTSDPLAAHVTAYGYPVTGLPARCAAREGGAPTSQQRSSPAQLRPLPLSLASSRARTKPKLNRNRVARLLSLRLASAYRLFARERREGGATCKHACYTQAA
jgi:hypothetical protein